VRILSTIGPLARDIDDLALALRVVAGPDAGDTDVPPVPLSDEPVPSLKGLRLAWAPTLPGVPVANEIAAAIERLATGLARDGAQVEQRLPALDFDRQRDLFAQLVDQVLGALQPPARGQKPASLADHLAALHERDAFIAAWDGFFAEWDALLCPVAMSTAFTHRDPGTPIDVDGTPRTYWDIASHCLPFNLGGQPAVVLPLAPASDGLPIGVQLVGRRWSEPRLLAIAKAMAPHTMGYRRPPLTDETRGNA
jgi:amidase